jgi:hypothetical protein
MFSIIPDVVLLTGIEPATFGLQNRCATYCATKAYKNAGLSRLSAMNRRNMKREEKKMAIEKPPYFRRF